MTLSRDERTNRPSAKRLTRAGMRAFREALEKRAGKKLSGRQWKKRYKEAQRRAR